MNIRLLFLVSILFLNVGSSAFSQGMEESVDPNAKKEEAVSDGDTPTSDSSDGSDGSSKEPLSGRADFNVQRREPVNQVPPQTPPQNQPYVPPNSGMPGGQGYPPPGAPPYPPAGQGYASPAYPPPGSPPYPPQGTAPWQGAAPQGGYAPQWAPGVYGTPYQGGVQMQGGYYPPTMPPPMMPPSQYYQQQQPPPPQVPPSNLQAGTPQSDTQRPAPPQKESLLGGVMKSLINGATKKDVPPVVRPTWIPGNAYTNDSMVAPYHAMDIFWWDKSPIPSKPQMVRLSTSVSRYWRGYVAEPCFVLVEPLSQAPGNFTFKSKQPNGPRGWLQALDKPDSSGFPQYRYWLDQ